jgi:AraC-like DNA-binding protein
MLSSPSAGTATPERLGPVSRLAPAEGPPPLLDAGHPLTEIDQLVRDVLHAHADAHVVPGPGLPDTGALVRTLMLQVLHAQDADDRLLEQLRYDLRFRWFAGLGAGDPVWTTCVHSRARHAFLASSSGRRLLAALLRAIRPLAQAWPRHFRFDDSLPDRWIAGTGADAQRAELLDASGFRTGTRAADPRLIRVLNRVVARIGDPDLNGNVLAADLGMSRRALYYLFEAQGLTPSQAIRNLRLSHCRRLLEDPRQHARKVTAIALDHGFRNACTFSRCFKQRYGLTPQACRPRHDRR